MRMYDNGIYRDMTEEEIKAGPVPAPPLPSIEQRLQALESAMLMQILGGATDV